MKTWKQVAEDQIERAKAHPPAVAIELLAHALRMKAIELDANFRARMADARGKA